MDPFKIVISPSKAISNDVFPQPTGPTIAYRLLDSMDKERSWKSGSPSHIALTLLILTKESSLSSTVSSWLMASWFESLIVRKVYAI